MPAARIYQVYAGRTGDRYLAHPIEELAKFEQDFAELEKKFGDVKFIGGDLIPPANVDQLAEKVRAALGRNQPAPPLPRPRRPLGRTPGETACRGEGPFPLARNATNGRREPHGRVQRGLRLELRL